MTKILRRKVMEDNKKQETEKEEKRLQVLQRKKNLIQ